MNRILIIDDDTIVVHDLKLLLENLGHTVIGSCDSLQEARILIKTTAPNLLFLDIELKDEIIFDLLEELTDRNFHVIFITAHGHYAIKAIKFGAFDYLLKPIEEEELITALNRLANHPFVNNIQNTVTKEYLKNMGTQNRMVLRFQDYLQVVDIDNIMYCESDGSYTHFFLADNRKLTASHTIKDYETLLSESSFIRTHHSFLVNNHYIDRLHRDGYLVLRNRIEIPISARRREWVKKILLGEAGSNIM